MDGVGTSDATTLLTGVAIVVAMNCLSSFGVNLQAFALRRGSVPEWDVPISDEGNETTPLLSSSLQPRNLFPPCLAFMDQWLWHLGFICYLIPQVFGSIIALNFISPILLAPLGSSGLVFNVLFSSMLVGSKVGKWDWAATALIIIGGTIVSLFGNVDVEIQTFQVLFQIFQSNLFMLYYPSIATALILCVVAAVLFETRKTRLFASAQALETSDSGGAVVNESEINRLKALAIAFDNHIGFLFSSAGGIAAALTLTIIKCGLNLIVGAIRGISILGSDSEVIISVFMVLALIASIVLQLVSLNKAIVFISPLIAIPVFYTFFTSLSVSNTLVIVFSIPGVILPENIGFTIQMAVLGVSIIVAGVWVLSYSSTHQEK